MFYASSGFSALRQTQAAASQCVRAAMNAFSKNKPVFGIFFATIHHHARLAVAVETIRKTAEIPHLIGSTAYGIASESHYCEESPAMALLLVGGESLRAQSLFIKNLQENNYGAGAELAETVFRQEFNTRALFLFPDHFSFDPSAFFEGFEFTHAPVPIIGATASEEGARLKSYQICNEEVFFDGLTGLTVRGPLVFETLPISACQPFSGALQVTRCEGESIMEIEGRPAYDIYLEQVARIEADYPGALENVFLGLPFEEYQKSFAPPNHFAIQPIREVNTRSGEIRCDMPVEEGSMLTFAVRDLERTRETLGRNLLAVQSKHQNRPIFGLYFNCCSQGKGFCGKNGPLSGFEDLLPGVPVVGTHTYAQLAPIDDVNHAHQYFGTLTLAFSDH